MYKFLVLPLFFAAVSAGVISSYHAAPVAVHAAPVAVHAAPVTVASHGHATSYANQHRIVHESIPVAHAVHAAPAVAVHAAPVHVASYGHGHHY